LHTQLRHLTLPIFRLGLSDGYKEVLIGPDVTMRPQGSGQLVLAVR
jgi:hypothetical protein